MLSSKQHEYELMEVSTKRPLKIQVINGPLIVCNSTWDYSTDLTVTKFKTTMDMSSFKHNLVTVVEIDLSPITPKKIYQVTVLRQDPSNLKNKLRTKTK